MSHPVNQPITLAQRINWTAAGVIIGLIGNMLVGAWYASSLSSRVGSLEEKMASIQSNGELLVRVDEKVKMVSDDMKDIKIQIEHLRSSK